MFVRMIKNIKESLKLTLCCPFRKSLQSQYLCVHSELTYSAAFSFMLIQGQ